MSVQDQVETMEWQEKIRKMDEKADEVIAVWSFGAFAANLLPPPFDVMAVATVFAKLGADIGEVYEVTLNWEKLVDIAKVIGTGISGAATASFLGSELLKWIPGLNVWVALLIQPPMVAAISYTAGNTFKNYYRTHITELRDLTPDEIKEMAESLLKSKMGN